MHWLLIKCQSYSTTLAQTKDVFPLPTIWKVLNQEYIICWIQNVQWSLNSTQLVMVREKSSIIYKAFIKVGPFEMVTISICLVNGCVYQFSCLCNVLRSLWAVKLLCYGRVFMYKANPWKSGIYGKDKN